MPESLEAYASSLSGFSQAAIDRACGEVERRVPGQFAPKFPPLGEMLDECRKAALAILHPTDSEWTLARYREAWELDVLVSEQVEEGKPFDQVLASLRRTCPSSAAMWIRWHNQTVNRTIQVPAGWCQICRGRGVTVKHDPQGASSMLTCECRKKAA